MTGKRYGDQFRNGQMMLQPSINDQQWRLKWSFWVLGSDRMFELHMLIGNWNLYSAGLYFCSVQYQLSIYVRSDWVTCHKHLIPLDAIFSLFQIFQSVWSETFCNLYKSTSDVFCNLWRLVLVKEKQTSVFLCCCSIGVKKWKYSHFARCFTVRIEECGSAQWPVHWVQCTVGSGSALSQCTRHSAQWAGSKISQKTPWQPPYISPMEGQWWWWWWLDVRSWGTGQWSLWW